MAENEKEVHPVTWEQISDFFGIVFMLGVIGLIGWFVINIGIWVFSSPTPTYSRECNYIEGWQFGGVSNAFRGLYCDDGTVWVATSTPLPPVNAQRAHGR